MLEKRDELDQALNEALASYGEPPENSGLDRRIMARIAEQVGRTHIKPSLVAVGAAAAVILVSLFWWGAPQRAIQNLPASTAVPDSKQIDAPRIRTKPVPEPGPVLVSAATQRTNRMRPRAEPKLARFPTPSPLSSEERALLQLLTRYPKDIPQELTNFGSPIKPVQIAAIQIKPLESAWNAKEKRCCD